MTMNQNLLGEQCFHRRPSSGGSDGSDCIIREDSIPGSEDSLETQNRFYSVTLAPATPLGKRKILMMIFKFFSSLKSS